MDITELTVGARSSPLSRAQVVEVQREINAFYPNLTFDCVFVRTTGDKDQKTSLRTLGKTDFFTKEIDALLLGGECRIAIHSAKDLPDPLPEGLALVALTRGQDSSDSLVFRLGDSVEKLPKDPVIATSSERREAAVREVVPRAVFKDVRGTIEQRLALLQTHACDGVVVAEAALIRLGLTYLHRIKLPGPTAEFQGQLAIIAREGDVEMHDLFACLDSRAKQG